MPAPTPWKAIAQVVPYPQLVKDPDGMRGTVVAYRVMVQQYDSRTTLQHMLANVTDKGYGFWTDTVFIDLPPPLDQNNVVQGNIISVWGVVVGSYTYKTALGGQNTVPEIEAKIIELGS